MHIFVPLESGTGQRNYNHKHGIYACRYNECRFQFICFENVNYYYYFGFLEMICQICNFSANYTNLQLHIYAAVADDGSVRFSWIPISRNFPIGKFSFFFDFVENAQLNENECKPNWEWKHHLKLHVRAYAWRQGKIFRKKLVASDLRPYSTSLRRMVR